MIVLELYFLFFNRIWERKEKNFVIKVSKLIICDDDFLFFVAKFLFLFLFGHTDAGLPVQRAKEVRFCLSVSSIAHQILHIVDFNLWILIFLYDYFRRFVDVCIAFNFLFFVDGVELFLIDWWLFFRLYFNGLGKEISDFVSGDEIAKFWDEEDPPQKGGFDQKGRHFVDVTLIVEKNV